MNTFEFLSVFMKQGGFAPQSSLPAQAELVATSKLTHRVFALTATPVEICASLRSGVRVAVDITNNGLATCYVVLDGVAGMVDATAGIPLAPTEHLTLQLPFTRPGAIYAGCAVGDSTSLNVMEIRQDNA